MVAVLVTGSNGGIGTAICSSLKSHGYFVIGTDIKADSNELDAYIKFDIRSLANDAKCREEFASLLKQSLGKHDLKAIINNAAVQILSGMDELQIDDFKQSLETNVVAPLALSKLCYSQLKQNKGSIVNIGSIHAKLTKPEFISYASSKAALLGLTQSMAVDCGQYVRVNAIQPAATATEMLLDGFKHNPQALNSLKAYHPTNSIATPDEIAQAVLFLISEQCPFLNGATLDINGGIGSRLHDPV